MIESLSVVVVAHAMERELPRTLTSLSRPYQRGIEDDDLEIVVVDNGSPTPIAASTSDPEPIVLRIEDAPASPAQAANVGIARASADLIGLVIDGARMASPSLLAMARLAAALGRRAVITAPAWHLGPTGHAEAAATGYDAAAEDRLLADVDWERDGYALFGVATPAKSSGRGLFGAMGESSSLFMRAELWDELGGLDERFTLPGGGLVNHDLYRRACTLPDVELIVLLGEGTFHQIHGGAATSGRVSREEMRADYAAIRGADYRPPDNDPLYLGRVPSSYLDYVASSAGRTRV